jgi:predicted ATPase
LITGAASLSPQRKREKLLEALLHQLEALARSRPVLMVSEDTHWVDPTSRELLDLTVARVAHIPVLLVITFRPEYQHGWGGEPSRHFKASGALFPGEAAGASLKLVGAHH